MKTRPSAEDMFVGKTSRVCGYVLLLLFRRIVVVDFGCEDVKKQQMREARMHYPCCTLVLMRVTYSIVVFHVLMKEVRASHSLPVTKILCCLVLWKIECI